MTDAENHSGALAELLDLTGLKCPLPALYTRRALERAEPGTALEVLSDDPMAAVDLPHMCREEGYSVERTEKQGGTVRMVIRRPPH
jgi:tRNA 2-thiouridine synthesizing protein A